MKCRCGAVARPELVDPRTLETVCGPCYDDFPWDEWERETGGHHTPRSEWGLGLGRRMNAEVAEAIRQTRRTLAEKTWVPRTPRLSQGEVCVAAAGPNQAWSAFRAVTGIWQLGRWNDRPTDVGAVLGMTLQALIAELCK